MHPVPFPALLTTTEVYLRFEIPYFRTVKTPIIRADAGRIHVVEKWIRLLVA